MLRWKKSVGWSPSRLGWSARLALSGLWPYTPLHAMATDRTETYAMATGPVDAEVEAVYFLDFLTGDLNAMVLGKQARTWTGFFNGPTWPRTWSWTRRRTPKFMMVTGMVTLRRAGGSR